MAALVAATAALTAAALAAGLTGIAQNSYGCVFSSSICGVAALHYMVMKDLRKKQFEDGSMGSSPNGQDKTDYMVLLVRHSDWLVRLACIQQIHTRH